MVYHDINIAVSWCISMFWLSMIKTVSKYNFLAQIEKFMQNKIWNNKYTHKNRSNSDHKQKLLERLFKRKLY